MMFNYFNKRFRNTWFNVSKTLGYIDGSDSDRYLLNESTSNDFDCIKESVEKFEFKDTAISKIANSSLANLSSISVIPIDSSSLDTLIREIKLDILQTFKELENESKLKNNFLYHWCLLILECNDILDLLNLSKTEEELKIVKLSLEKIKLQINNLQKKSIIRKNDVLKFQNCKNVINFREYKLLMIHTCSKSKRGSLVKKIQFRLIYTLLYYTGLPLAFLRKITRENIFEALETDFLSYVHPTEKTLQSFFLVEQAKNDLLLLKPNLKQIFFIDDLKYLSCSLRNNEKPMSEKAFINLVSVDMKYCLNTMGNLEGKFSSENFRHSLIQKLLQITTIEIMEKIVKKNHKDLSRTMLENILPKIFI